MVSSIIPSEYLFSSSKQTDPQQNGENWSDLFNFERKISFLLKLTDKLWVYSKRSLRSPWKARWRNFCCDWTLRLAVPGVSNTRPAWCCWAARVIKKTIKYDWNYCFSCCLDTFYLLLRPEDTYLYHKAAREFFFRQNVALEWIWVWDPWAILSLTPHTKIAS
jgi:hypothetical protein